MSENDEQSESFSFDAIRSIANSEIINSSLLRTIMELQMRILSAIDPKTDLSELQNEIAEFVPKQFTHYARIASEQSPASKP